MRIFIVSPTYNEVDNVENTINKVLSVSKNIVGHDVNVLVIDGNSPDGTSEKVKNISSKNSNVFLITEKEKAGLGAAYLEAFDYVFNVLNADAVISFDADLSHDADTLPIFIKKLEDGYEFVNGTRYIRGAGVPKEWNLQRKLLSICGNLFIRILYFNLRITDFTSGFKAIKKDIYSKIRNKLVGHGGYTFSIATNIECAKNSKKVTEIPYIFKDRVKGQSKMGSEYFKNALTYTVKTRVLDILNSRFGKVFVAGSAGASAQLITYGLIFRPLFEVKNILDLPSQAVVLGVTINPPILLSLLLSIEVGIFVSFTINNNWAFGDSKLSGLVWLRRYIKNHFVVTGAILIQIFTIQFFINLFGKGLLLEYIYQMFGILLGLIWNFYFYKKVIWKVK